MRILSQNRKTSVQFERTILHVNDGSITFYDNGKEYSLGLYESDDRAFEVLEDIHDKYDDMFAETVYKMPKG